jgi:hypothetical protein
MTLQEEFISDKYKKKSLYDILTGLTTPQLVSLQFKSDVKRKGALTDLQVGYILSRISELPMWKLKQLLKRLQKGG